MKAPVRMPRTVLSAEDAGARSWGGFVQQVAQLTRATSTSIAPLNMRRVLFMDSSGLNPRRDGGVPPSLNSTFHTAGPGGADPRGPWRVRTWTLKA